jgi:hypothetical protein
MGYRWRLVLALGTAGKMLKALNMLNPFMAIMVLNLIDALNRLKAVHAVQRVKVVNRFVARSGANRLAAVTA